MKSYHITSHIVIFLLLFCLPLLKAQENRLSFAISNNITGLPVVTYPALFYSQFHPGLDFRYSTQMNSGEKNLFFFNLSAGGYYHQFVQSLVRIHPSISYERVILPRFNMELGIGGGYGLSFEGDNAFIKEEDGSYSPKPFFGARSQYLIAFDIGGNYALSNNSPHGTRLSLKFGSFLQGTFVNNYVPILPLNSFFVGIIQPLNFK